MHHQVTVIGQHPLGLVIAFQAGRQLAGLTLELQVDFIVDRLHLFLIVAGADDEVVGKAGDPRQIQDLDIGGFFGFGGADCDQPGRLRSLRRFRDGRFRLGQRMRTPVRIVLQRRWRVPRIGIGSER